MASTHGDGSDVDFTYTTTASSTPTPHISNVITLTTTLNMSLRPPLTWHTSTATHKRLAAWEHGLETCVHREARVQLRRPHGHVTQLLLVLP